MTSKFKEKLNKWTSDIGGIPGLAAKLNIQRQAIYQWPEIPHKRLLDVEKITGVSRAELRPDLFKGFNQHNNQATR